MDCSYPDCDCAVSFPGGYQPSNVTECPREVVFKERADADARMDYGDPGVGLSALSHSYPFLGLSRKFDVPYSDVLRAVAVIDHNVEHGMDPCRMTGVGPFGRAVLAVCRAPWRWQYPPQGRGL